MDRGDAERLFQLLASEAALGERFERNSLGFTNAYVMVGQRSKDVLAGKLKLTMAFSSEGGGGRKEVVGKKGDAVGKNAGGKKGAEERREAAAAAAMARQNGGRGPISAELCETDEEDEDEIDEDFVVGRNVGGSRAKDDGKDLHMRCLEELQACRYQVRFFPFAFGGERGS